MRTIEDAKTTEQNLAKIHPKAKLWHFPMAELSLLKQKISSWDSSAHLIITSKNAVRWLVEHHIDRNFVLSCVGQQTALLAKSFGYEHVQHVAKNAALLMEQLICEPKDTYFMYLRGKTIRHDICHSLINKGYYNTQELVVYDMIPNAQPFKKFPKELYHESVVFLLYSHEQALALHKQFDWQKFDHATMIAISKHVADPFISMENIRTLWAEYPNEAAMMECLKKLEHI